MFSPKLFWVALLSLQRHKNSNINGHIHKMLSIDVGSIMINQIENLYKNLNIFLLEISRLKKFKSSSIPMEIHRLIDQTLTLNEPNYSHWFSYSSGIISTR